MQVCVTARAVMHVARVGQFSLGEKDTEATLPDVKTSFNYCSSGSGQNSVIPDVCDVPE